MAMKRLRIQVDRACLPGQAAELIVRRLLCEQYSLIQSKGRDWLEFRQLSDDQIEGFVRLLQSRGVRRNAWQLIDFAALRAVLDQQVDGSA